jgi:tripartite-type tricarboxylate transporter receptor subunit TctC
VKRPFLAALLVAAAAIALTPSQQARAQADGFPSKPIRLIVPFAPGGSATTVARLLGQKMTEDWGQAVIVDNKPGANSIIGTELLTKSPPDGYTLLLIVSTHVINPSLMKLPYDTFRDFTPITTMYSTEYVLTVHPSVPVNTVQEFIALAKSKPGSLNYAAGDTAGVTHLAAETLNMRAGIKMQAVPYKGSAPALTDTVAGHVQVFFGPPIAAAQHVRGGQLRALAVSGNQRYSGLPEVPTFTEAGLPNLDVKTWFGLLAPAGTPRPIVDKIHKEVVKIMAMPDVREKLASYGLEPFTSTPEEFDALMRADLVKFERIIKAASIKAE